MDFSERRKPLARRGAKRKYPHGPLFKIKTNLLNEEYTAECKAGGQGNLMSTTTVHHRTEPIAKGLFKHACMPTTRKPIGTKIRNFRTIGDHGTG